MEKPAPKSLYTDPRFLEVMRELRGIKLASPSCPEDEADEVTRRIRVKIELRMKKRNVKR
jgi:hypothetical protein